MLVQQEYIASELVLETSNGKHYHGSGRTTFVWRHTYWEFCFQARCMLSATDISNYGRFIIGFVR